jgi:Shikimate kinase
VLNKTALKRTEVVYLQVGYQQAMQRVAGDQYRPLLARPGLDDLFQRRLDVYGAVASLTIATDGRRPEAISQDVIDHLLQVPLPRLLQHPGDELPHLVRGDDALGADAERSGGEGGAGLRGGEHLGCRVLGVAAADQRSELTSCVSRVS